MLCLFPSCLLQVETDLGIAFAISDACHAEVHTNFGALAVEVSHKLLADVFLIFSADVGIVLYGLCVNTILVLSCKLELAFLLNKLLCRNLAYRALLRSSFSLVNITAYRTYKLCHNNFPPNFFV